MNEWSGLEGSRGRKSILLPLLLFILTFYLIHAVLRVLSHAAQHHILIRIVISQATSQQQTPLPFLLHSSPHYLTFSSPLFSSLYSMINHLSSPLFSSPVHLLTAEDATPPYPI
jgi:hypothetical protein